MSAVAATKAKPGGVNGASNVCPAPPRLALKVTLMKRSTAGASLQLNHLGLLTINGLQELEKHRVQQIGLAHCSQRFNGCGRHTVTPHRSRVKVFEVTVLKNLNYLD